MRTVRVSWIIIGVFCVILLGMPEIVSKAADAYDGASTVSVTSGNLNPLKGDSAKAKASGCATGNRWGNSNIDSSVNATGYIFYYSPSNKRYEKRNFNESASINKPGTSKELISKKGKDLDKKYDDVYAMSIFCKFKLTCNQCGADVTRTRTASE